MLACLFAIFSYFFMLIGLVRTGSIIMNQSPGIRIWIKNRNRERVKSPKLHFPGYRNREGKGEVYREDLQRLSTRGKVCCVSLSPLSTPPPSCFTDSFLSCCLLLLLSPFPWRVSWSSHNSWIPWSIPVNTPWSGDHGNEVSHAIIRPLLFCNLAILTLQDVSVAKF